MIHCIKREVDTDGGGGESEVKHTQKPALVNLITQATTFISIRLSIESSFGQVVKKR